MNNNPNDNVKRPRGRPRKTEEEKVKRTQEIQCEICGGIYQRNNGWKHRRTKIHQSNLKMLNLIKGARLKEINKKSMTLTELRASRYGKKISDPDDEIDESEFIIEDNSDLSDIIIDV